MFTRHFHSRHFIASVYGTPPFIAYCDQHEIGFRQVPGWLMREEEYDAFERALRACSSAVQAQIEFDMLQVNELASPASLALLTSLATDVPPDDVPSGAATALWFHVHQPDVFRQALLCQEVQEVEAWRVGCAPAGLAVDPLDADPASLASSLREFFRMHEGSGRFCAVEKYTVGETLCYVANLADRLHLLSMFTEEGRHTLQPTRPAFSVLFAYDRTRGRVLLKSRQRSRERVTELLQRFGRAVLGVELPDDCLIPAFRLDVLKQRFDPLPDAADMEFVRVKALTLGYPHRAGGRRVKLETLSNDDKFAILDLLSRHGGTDEQLRVLYAELQVKLRTESGSKSVPIRLWPDRCSLNQSPLGNRLSTCLRQWGIAYDR